ncbi:unnamed protein product [Sympodiomycopsis kandeliae]
MASSSKVTQILRGSLRTSPGPGGAGSIGSYTQPCRKIILTYCNETPASQGVRQWLLGNSNNPESGIISLARKWPQIEWVLREGKRGQEPFITAHYVNAREKTIGLHMFTPLSVKSKMELLLSSTGRKLSGSGSRSGFNTSESRNYKKKPVEINRLAEPVRGHWSGFGSGSS